MLLYRLFIWLYPKAAFLLGFYNPKAREWCKGRKGIFKKIATAFHHNQKPVIWMHCASLGEFEQGLPVLKALIQQYPQHTSLVTFFSPSGYEVRKGYPGIDHIFYLPMDSPSHATRFFNIVQPSLVLFIKYDFWFYYLQEASHRGIPLLLVSGAFRKEQVFFTWYGGWYRSMLSFFTYMFVQNPSSASLLASIGFQNKVIIAGDTRFDRVIEVAGRFTPVSPVAHFCNTRTVLVAGSTWTEDDEALDHFANTHPDLRCIIVPHEIEEERLQECTTLYKNAMLYSSYVKAFYSGSVISPDIHVLIIDNVGMLSSLYHYAHIAYIGGGFGEDGIHNILEAAVYGKPIVFGPEYDKYMEATELLDLGGACSVEDALELEALLTDWLDKPESRNTVGEIAAKYVLEKSGATQKVVGYIQENRLLTN